MSNGQDTANAQKVSAAHTGATVDDITTVASYTDVTFDFGKQSETTNVHLEHAVSLLAYAVCDEGAEVNILGKPHKDYPNWITISGDIVVLAGVDKELFADTIRFAVVKFQVKYTSTTGTFKLGFIAK